MLKMINEYNSYYNHFNNYKVMITILSSTVLIALKAHGKCFIYVWNYLTVNKFKRVVQ